jgi:hypothetical protein
MISIYTSGRLSLSLLRPMKRWYLVSVVVPASDTLCGELLCSICSLMKKISVTCFPTNTNLVPWLIWRFKIRLELHMNSQESCTSSEKGRKPSLRRADIQIGSKIVVAILSYTLVSLDIYIQGYTTWSSRVYFFVYSWLLRDYGLYYWKSTVPSPSRNECKAIYQRNAWYSSMLHEIHLGMLLITLVSV